MNKFVFTSTLTTQNNFTHTCILIYRFYSENIRKLLQKPISTKRRAAVNRTRFTQVTYNSGNTRKSATRSQYDNILSNSQYYSKYRIIDTEATNQIKLEVFETLATCSIELQQLTTQSSNQSMRLRNSIQNKLFLNIWTFHLSRKLPCFSKGPQCQ